VLASTLACTTANASVNYTECTCNRELENPLPHWGEENHVCQPCAVVTTVTLRALFPAQGPNVYVGNGMVCSWATTITGVTGSGTVSACPAPPPPQPPPPPPCAPGTSVVSTAAGLTSALANTTIGHIVLAPGTYSLSAELSVTRSVILEAAVSGTVVLNAQASSSSQRRVLLINPGSSGVVQLIRLSITGGYIGSVCALRSSKFPSAPM
jgi:hypothetical protein